MHSSHNNDHQNSNIQECLYFTTQEWTTKESEPSKKGDVWLGVLTRINREMTLSRDMTQPAAVSWEAVKIIMYLWPFISSGEQR